MFIIKRGFRLSMCGSFVAAILLGLADTALAWIEPPQDYPDVAIGSGSENQMAIDPANPNQMVIGTFDIFDQCVIYTSVDAGETWSLAADPPECTGAVGVTYALSGGIIYAAYRNSAVQPGVNFSFSLDQGATWSTPTISASPLEPWDSLYGLRLAAGLDGSLYAVFLAGAPPSPSGFYCRGLYVSASTDEGASWRVVQRVDWVCPEEGKDFVGGFSVAAGRGGDVIVAYGLDSWKPGQPRHDYALQIATSADYGGSFAHRTADRSTSDVQDFTVGYESDLTIARRGMARLVYTKHTKDGSAILYKRSPPPYGKWSGKPVRINPEFPIVAVNSPHIAVGVCGSTNIVHAAWTENITTPVYTRKIALPGYRWSRPFQFFASRGFSNYVSALTAAGAEAFATQYSWNRYFFISFSRVWSGVTCR